jgi:protoporphyrinogen oxidase
MTVEVENMTEKEKIVILGAGVGGLAAGYFLARTGRYSITVLEKEAVIGGLCASFEQDGFVLDYGAHKLYSVIPGILDEIRSLMGDRLMEVPKKNRLFLRDRLVDYPLRLGNLAKALGLGMFMKIGLGYGIELLKSFFNRTPPASYEDYILRRFGRPTYELVFEPLAEKVWGDPATLHPEMARTRVPASGGLEVILKLLGLKKETAETNAEIFLYPRAGFGDFPQAMAEEIEKSGGQVLVNANISELKQDKGQITAVEAIVDGTETVFPADYVVSSIPLAVLGRMVFGDRNTTFNQAVEDLQFRHLVLVYVFAKRDLVLDDQWIFFPEKHLVFSRIFEQKQMNPALGPKGKSVITADFTTAEGSQLWKATDAELAQKVIDGLVQSRFIQADEIETWSVIRKRNFYPRYDLAYASKMQTVSDNLRQVKNLLTTGRIGMYNYNNSDHCADMGLFIAEKLSAGIQPSEIWQALEKRVQNYKIVD